MSESTDKKARGLDAAMAFASRMGMTLDECKVPRAPYAFVAIDGEERVVVQTRTHTGETTTDVRVPRAVRRFAESIGARLDTIDLRVITVDRAILRHHRGIA